MIEENGAGELVLHLIWEEATRARAPASFSTSLLHRAQFVQNSINIGGSRTRKYSITSLYQPLQQQRLGHSLN